MSQLQAQLIAAAIGATIGVISAAGIFLYQKILENKQHTMKNQNLDEVNRQIAQMQTQLELLRAQQSQRKKKKLSRKNVSSKDTTTYTVTDNDTDVDAFSTAGTDAGDDEFFDCSDSENGISDIERTEGTRTGLDFDVWDAHYLQQGNEEVDCHDLEILMRTNPNNVDLGWRFARSCYKLSSILPNMSNEKKLVILKGIDICEKLLSSQDADVYKWYAILIGLYGDYLPTAEKIQNGYRFRELVTKALEIRPSDANLHHLLGRFKYEVANLSWIERKVAATLFSEPPSASYEEALESFQEAEKLSDKVHLENQLFLSKCYIALSKYEEALHWLKKICDISTTLETDVVAQNNAQELLNKYSGYC